MTKVGDKFVIEVADIIDTFDEEDNRKLLYKIKGFNALVFDDVGLKKLKKVKTVYMVDGDE